MRRILIGLIIGLGLTASAHGETPIFQNDPWLTFTLPAYMAIPGTCDADLDAPIPTDWAWIWCRVSYRVDADSPWMTTGEIPWADVAENLDSGRFGVLVQLPQGYYDSMEGFAVLVDEFGQTSCASDTVSCRVSKRYAVMPGDARWTGVAP